MCKDSRPYIRTCLEISRRRTEEGCTVLFVCDGEREEVKGRMESGGRGGRGRREEGEIGHGGRERRGRC